MAKAEKTSATSLSGAELDREIIREFGVATPECRSEVLKMLRDAAAEKAAREKAA